MRRVILRVLAAFAVVATAAACSSSGSGGTSTPSTEAPASASKGTYTIGVLADMTGPASSGNKSVVNGIKAGIVAVARDGYTIKYVVADTGTSLDTARSAAQKLVQRDHVVAVVAHSAIAFAAAPYLNAQHVPVIGAGEDGPEWATDTNMFPVYGALHTEKVATTFGKFMKLVGASTVGTLGYDVSPISAQSAKANAVSAQIAGLRVGYVNARFPFGGTDVGPAALAMKAAGVDAVALSVDPNTSYALISELRKQGVNLKAAVLAVGYGADILQAGPGALNAAQNVYYTLQMQPIEMNTPATKAFTADLRQAGTTTVPTLPEYDGYASILLLVEGLKAAGATPTKASLITALSGIHRFTAGGLYGDHPLDVNDRVNLVGGPDNCIYFTRLVGTDFTLIPGADPICGETVPGRTVSQ
jgi:ABC-type branched-subunit amino acid transport system substrate-binding protein